MSMQSGVAAADNVSSAANDLQDGEQAADILLLAAQLVRLKTRVSDLDALDQFSQALIGEIRDGIDRRSFCYH